MLDDILYYLSFFNWFDAIIILVFIFFILLSFFKGVAKEFFSLFSWIISFPIAYRIAPLIQPILDDYIDNECIVNMLSIFICFLFTIISLLVTTHAISECVKNSKLKKTNQWLGTVVGFLKSLCLFSIFYMCLFLNDTTNSKLNFARTAYCGKLIHVTLYKTINHLNEKEFDKYIFKFFNIDIEMHEWIKALARNNLSGIPITITKIKQHKPAKTENLKTDLQPEQPAKLQNHINDSVELE